MDRVNDQDRDPTDRVVESSRRLLELERRPVPRDQHPKMHGCVRARFVVAPGLDDTLRRGLFANGRVYEAWVRFSNGQQRDDRRPDAHGMAVKLMGVEGSEATTHDFVMVDHPTFFLRGAEEYAGFSEAVLRARGKDPSYVRSTLAYLLPDRLCALLTLLFTFFFPWRLRMLGRMIAFASRRIANPLRSRYWSTTAYKFDDAFMKFSAVPGVLPEDRREPAGPSYEEMCAFLADAKPLPGRTSAPGDVSRRSKDYLREEMGAALADRGALFLFQIQVSRDTRRTPVDDPCVEWLESDVPPRTVAYVWIPPQEFRNPARDAFGENLSFTPWHAHPAHTPVGQINEMRKRVYDELSADRHRVNGLSAREPVPTDDPDQCPVDVPCLAEFGPDPTAFSAVLADELDRVYDRRKGIQSACPPGIEVHKEVIEGANEDERVKRQRLRALRGHVTGLAISGGGIRSGTFAVGFLQGLAALGLIRRLDFLSTVSGGGYAGAWLTAWLRREGGDPDNVERMLSPSRVTQATSERLLLAQDEVVDPEPSALRHLREYSSYLFPHPGVLSADTWTVVLIWSRNVIINLMMLVPAVMLAVVASRLTVAFYRYFNPLEVVWGPWFLGFFGLVTALGLLCVYTAFRATSDAVWSLRDRSRPDPAMGAVGTPAEVQALVNRVVINRLTAAALLLTAVMRPAFWGAGILLSWLRQAPDRLDSVTPQTIVQDAIFSHLGLLDWPAFTGSALFFAVLLWLATWRNARRETGPRRARFVRAAALAGATGGVGFVLLVALVRWFALREAPDLMATLAAPLGLLLVVFSFTVLVALLGRAINEAEREWWARLSALCTLRALIWIGFTATVLYVPGVLLASGPWLKTAVASGWVASAVFGVITGRFVVPRTRGAVLFSLQTLAAAASSVFLVGLVGLVALLVSLMANDPSLITPTASDLSPFQYFVLGVNQSSALILLVIGLVSAVLYSQARDLIDVNLFSLNAMYANRLTRCYLGASRAMEDWAGRWGNPRNPLVDTGAPSVSHDDVSTRRPNPVTAFDPDDDDLDLASLRIGQAERGREYLGPHLLVNTTLNLVGEGSLSRRDRKGESFVLSPLYCGSQSVGYARLEPPRPGDDEEPCLTLGRAIAVSGAAVDPNMSFYQSGPLTALLTLFNARLGYWIEKPRASGWKARSPKLGNLLLSEFFGRTDERGEYVHISDGGHFENLGVYELIRRRCRYVVALDAADDDNASSDNLGNLVRLCRTDFGIRIRIDTSPLAVEGPDKLSRTHVVIGVIHYDDVDRGETPGILVYVKISMTGDEAPDVQRYARSDPRFPHQPTDLRQSFNEEQFECYRCLGDHIAREVFSEAVRELADDLRHDGREAATMPHTDYVPRLFEAVRQHWAEAPGVHSPLYAEANRAWSEIQRDLSLEAALAPVSDDLFPELALMSPAERPTRAELHSVARLLALMENSWLALSLNRNSTLPVNRGWVNAFRRWVGTGAFRKAWPILRSGFSSDFVRFCEEQLHLTAAKPAAVRLSGHYDGLDPSDPQRRAIDLLDVEFAREWPAEDRAGRGLGDRVRQAVQTDGRPMVWLLDQAASGPETAADTADAADRLVCGVVLAVRSAVPADVKARAGAGPDPVELFVWVCRPYRSSGLGSAAFQGGRLAEIRAELAGEDRTRSVPLWACYPKAGVGDDEIEYANFLRFLSRYDFRPIPREGDGGGRPGSIMLLTSSNQGAVEVNAARGEVTG
ncbi:MAG: hypothetical protein U0835_22210 [Isosphaeraceae bacterium]